HGANWPYWHADLDPFDFYVYPWGMDTPPGKLAERIRESPALDAKYHDAVATMAGDPFDVAALTARIDQIAEVLHQADDVPGDLDTALDDAREVVEARKAYLEGL